MGFSIMLCAKKLVPVEYWCPYGTCISLIALDAFGKVYVCLLGLFLLLSSFRREERTRFVGDYFLN